MWCEEAQCWVRILERKTLFGNDVAKVLAEGSNRTFTVSADLLMPTHSFNLSDALSVVAGARIWSALGSDLFLAPMMSAVIPLPHQFRVLRRTTSAFPVRKLLADEVGLGKTIEAGLILKEMKLRGMIERILILAPKSLLLQWISEMDIHFGEEFELVEPGTWGIGATLSGNNPWKKYKQVVVSYDSVKPRDNQKGWTKERIDRFNLERFHDLVGAGWDLVIMDESHKVAGSSDDVARHELAKNLAKAIPHILLLSATPHSGKSDAFRRLLSLLEPTSFPEGTTLNKQTVSLYLIRTEKRSTTDSDGKPLFSQRSTKLVKVPFEDRHNLQQLLYEAVSEYVRESYNLAERHGEKKGYRLLLLLIQRLMSSSTRAVKTFLERRLDVILGNEEDQQLGLTDVISDDTDMDDVVQLALFVEKASRKESDDVHRLLDLAIRTENAGPDARAEALYDLMISAAQEESDPATKFLMFTEFTATQEMLKEFLELRGYTVVTINGGMGLEERKVAQENFRDNAHVLISTDAGGEGLNLQFAHIIFNYDLPWNPMRVEQRIGRVDRIGQKHEVKAFNLVLQNSIEARIYDVWVEKLAAILQQLGIDKTGDVLDSKDTAAQFERLAKVALLKPDVFDTEFERVIVEIRSAVKERQSFASLVETAPDELEGTPIVPLNSWLNTLMSDNQSETGEGKTADISSIVLERINSLRCHYTPEKPVPKLSLKGLGFELDCWFSIWKVGIAEGMWRQQHVFAMCLADNGNSYTKSAQRIWDELAVNTSQVSFDGEIEDYDIDTIFGKAEADASILYEHVVDATKERAWRRMNAIDLSYLARKQAIKQIGLSQVRENRLADLEIEYKNRRNETALAAKALPDLQCLFLARVSIQ
ncbi:MAG: DEAD/DEAH box helicase [Armatimonadota bacterium]